MVASENVQNLTVLNDALKAYYRDNQAYPSTRRALKGVTQTVRPQWYSDLVSAGAIDETLINLKAMTKKMARLPIVLMAKGKN
jgi:hypothetical protein